MYYPPRNSPHSAWPSLKIFHAHVEYQRKHEEILGFTKKISVNLNVEQILKIN